MYAFNISFLSWCPDYLRERVVEEHLPSGPSVPALYFMCALCMPAHTVVNVCVRVGVSSQFCPHIIADRQTAQCSTAVFDRLINTGSGRRQQTQFVFRAETFKPPFDVTTLRGIMSFLHCSLPHRGSVFLPPASTDMWSGCFCRHLHQKCCFPESVCMIWENLWWTEVKVDTVF